jgi:two-component system sensor histidine kinase HydH
MSNQSTERTIDSRTSIESRGRWARRGWLATTALLALVLVLHALVSFAGARHSVDGLDRGQADLLDAGLREMLAARGDLSDSVILARFLQINHGRGLRFVALSADGAHAGTSVAGTRVIPPPPRDSATGRLPLVPVGNRLRDYVPGLFGSAPLSEQPSYMILEFAPTASARLLGNARRTLGLAIAAALVLSFAAWMFLRTSIRYDEARFRLEQQRHLAVLGEMSAVLAHEIRNPLAALKGHAQLAYERLADGSREKTCIGFVVECANRLDELTSNLLSFARSGSIERSPVDPVELMRTAVRDVFGDSPIAVEADDAPTQWPLDGGRVRQALVNLLDNARQSSPTGIAPIARVGRQSDRLVFEIRDYGAGLPAGREERIFDAFFTTRTNGTGLGLAVASRVAEMHGGEITARNLPDTGAMFRLSLPSLGNR